MDSFTETDAYQVIWLTRRLFRALARRSDEIIEDLGVSASDRAVLEFLHPARELSVPDIAARYEVSRQHIQVTVNRLKEKKLVEQRANPRHKRSPLFRMTAQGRELFATILHRDEQTVRALCRGIPGNRLQTTRKTLNSLLQRLEERAR